MANVQNLKFTKNNTLKNSISQSFYNSKVQDSYDFIRTRKKAKLRQIIYEANIYASSNLCKILYYLTLLNEFFFFFFFFGLEKTFFLFLSFFLFDRLLDII